MKSNQTYRWSDINCVDTTWWNQLQVQPESSTTTSNVSKSWLYYEGSRTHDVSLYSSLCFYLLFQKTFELGKICTKTVPFFPARGGVLIFFSTVFLKRSPKYVRFSFLPHRQKWIWGSSFYSLYKGSLVSYGEGRREKIVSKREKNYLWQKIHKNSHF